MNAIRRSSASRLGTALIAASMFAGLLTASATLAIGAASAAQNGGKSGPVNPAHPAPPANPTFPVPAHGTYTPMVPLAGSVPRTVIYDEGFQNTSNGGGLPITSYVGTAGDTFTANPYYLDYTQCNGIDLYGTETLGGSICSKYANPAQLRVNAENSMRGFATALGGSQFINNLGSNNRAVTYLTSNLQIPEGLVELETAQPATLGAAVNKFIGFSINSSEVCYDGLSNFVQPTFQFLSKTSAGLTGQTGGFNPCSTYWDRGSVNGGTAILSTSSQVGFRVVNFSGGGVTGNDMGLDDFVVWDETPKVTNSFNPTELATGKTLTFTVTNTSDGLAKNGWSFTNTLPTGLVQVPGTTPTTTCPASVATASSATQLSMQGNLNARMASCTFTVPVTSATAGTYKITVTNTGQLAYTAPVPASFTDSLINVLDDATYNADATATSGATAYDSSTQSLSWSGALALGQVVTVTYTVTVNSPDLGDLQLLNADVTPPGVSCLSGSTSSDCKTKVTDVPPSSTTGQPSGGLAFTGVTTGPQLELALLAFVLGFGLLLLARRRRDLAAS